MIWSWTCTQWKISKRQNKSYNGKINTNFHDNIISKEGSQCNCLSVILIISAFRIGKNHYPQVFVEECKYVAKEKKTPEYITEDIDISSDDSDREENSCRGKFCLKEFFIFF